MKLPVKLGIMLILILLLCIPLLMISGTSHERKSYKNEVISEIAKSFGGEQKIITPYVLFQYDKPVSVKKDDVETISVKSYSYYISPLSVNVDGKLKVERKYRRIYSTAVFIGDFNLSGKIKLSQIQLNTLTEKDVQNVNAWLMFGVSDAKGFRGVAAAVINGAPLEMFIDKSYSNVMLTTSSLDKDALLAGGEIDFDITLPLNGTSKLSFVSSGLENNIALAGDWPHPSFTGAYLPHERSVTHEGFTALWQPSWLTGLVLDKEGHLTQQGNNPFNSTYGNDFGVTFLELVDIYSLVDRSVKYGFLVVCLTFLVIFVLETIYRSNIHPIQYGLVGSALVVFFMLLLSLSEHISFGLSYLLSALVCIALITFYIYFSLKNIKSTSIFSAFLAMLYFVLYILLNTSDYALLIGSALIFITLAIIMVATRNINWYKINETQ